MKKSTTILFALLISGAIVSCQKEENAAAPEQDNLIHKTITISDEPWTADSQTKSLYEKGVGVHLNKLENMSVYYWKFVEGKSAPEKETCPLFTMKTSDGKNIKGAEASAEGVWDITHDALDNVDKYNYYFIIPHNSTNALNNSGLNATGHSFRLSSVQIPETINSFLGCEKSELSFDPTMDCYMGQAKININKTDALSDIHFKRVFAPVKLVINDTKGILNNENIYSVSIKSDAVATQKQTMTGIMYFNHNEDYDKAGIRSIDEKTVGNGISAIYDEKKPTNVNDSYTIWFIVNPTTLPAGENLTVSVTTAKYTYTRTTNIPKELVINADAINILSFDISGEGYTKEESDYYCFFNLTNVNKVTSVVGSNSTKKPWSHTKCNLLKDVGNSKFKNAFRIQSGSNLKYTAIENKTLKKVRFYGHPRAQTSTVTIVVKSGDKEIGTIAMKYGDLSKNGGYSELEIPNEYSQSELTFNFNDKEAAISAATLFFGEESTTGEN